MGRAILILTFALVGLGIPQAAQATTCRSEIERVEQRLAAVRDPVKQGAVRALLEQARRAAAAGDMKRCYADVDMARRALR